MTQPTGRAGYDYSFFVQALQLSTSQEISMNYGLHHVALSTPDLDRCLDFYCTVLGAERASPILNWEIGATDSDRSLQVRDSSARFAHIKVGKAYIEIFEFHTPPPVQPDRRSVDFGIAHLCFQVDDLEAEYERTSALGMTFHSPPVVFDDGSKYVYGRDVDGNIIELLEVPHGVGYARQLSGLRSGLTETLHRLPA